MVKQSLSTLKESEKQARKDLIIEAAERVFADKPFDKVSIRDIAKEAGISHALIYRYFPDQQSLFVEAFLRGAEIIILNLHEIVSKEESDAAEATKLFIEYLVEHDQYFRMMTHFMLDGSLNENLVNQLNGVEKRLLDQFEILFKKKYPEKETRLLAHALFASLNGVLITFINYPGRGKDEVVSHMIRLGHIIASRFLG